jgi:hypothetical protein
MDTKGFAALNAADRDRIREKVTDALKEVGYNEDSMRRDESYVLDTEEGEIRIPIEIIVYLDERPALLVKCVRGNMSTRERASLSLARLLAEKPIPFAIVANERDAVVFDAITGKATGRGYQAFPGPARAEQRLRDCTDFLISSAQRKREARILETYYHIRCTVDMEPF